MDIALHSIRPDVLTPGTRIEHWRVLESLGQRAHGALFRVEDVRHPAEPLALRLSARASEGRFQDRVARLMEAHPNVARLHAYGRWTQAGSGLFFCVREDVQGRALPEWVESANPTFLQVAALLSRLASAIDDMHARDTWHRDIHPENIQVREADAEPVLLDLRTGGNEDVEALIHSPLAHELQVFRSPEALRFLRTNWGRRNARYHYLPTDDLYALGATAYWLVTGHSPFSPGLSPDQLHTEIELRAPLPPWEVNPRVPKPLGAIILRLMSKLPDARPQRGETLCAELMVAVSAGARSMWARRVFDWEQEQADACASAPRIRRPQAPHLCPRPGPRLPRIVHFEPSPERRMSELEPPSRRGRAPGGLPDEPLGPWSHMM